jgi:hypothetical protein
MRVLGRILAMRAGAAGYSLAGPSLEVHAEGDVRIFERSRAVGEDGWLVVVFSVPESERDKRHALRKSLTSFALSDLGVGVARIRGIAEWFMPLDPLAYRRGDPDAARPARPPDSSGPTARRLRKRSSPSSGNRCRCHPPADQDTMWSGMIVTMVRRSDQRAT